MVLTGRLGRAWRSAASRAAVLACSSARSTTARQCTLLKASDLHRTGAADVGDHDLLTVAADPYRLPGEPVVHRSTGRDRTQINGVFSAIVHVTPNAAVNGAAGNRCACSVSISTGGRRVTRCARG